MADNYLEFSEVIANLTEAEEAWLKKQLQAICVFGDKECAEDAVPAELADTEPDWSGIRFLRDKDDHDPTWDHLDFAYRFQDDPDKGGWGRHLWLYAEESGNPDNVAHLVQKFLKKFRPNKCWALTWASTCSKPRIGEFGGGAVFVTAGEIKRQDAYEFIETQRAAFRWKDGGYVSVWDDDITCRSPCKFDPATARVSAVEKAANQEDAESCSALTDEYVEVDGKQLRERDGVIFEYKEDEA
jgi:hypothetical protein